MKKLFAFVAAAMLALSPAAFAQNFTLPDGSVLGGRVIASDTAAPTPTGGTLASGSSDTAGTFTASAAAGSIAFSGSTWNSAPSCLVVDSSATPLIVYAVTTAQITLTTLTSGHVYQYLCLGKIGG